MAKKSERWYAVQVKNIDVKVFSGLDGNGEEVYSSLPNEFFIEEFINESYDVPCVAYCPGYVKKKKRTRHARKFEEVKLPLYDRWLFVKFNGDERPWDTITEIKNVDGFLATGSGDPLPIHGRVIDMIRRECELGVYNEFGIGGSVRQGDKVEISGNSTFSGFSGEFQKLNLNRTAVIELSIFGRSTIVELPTQLIKRIL